MPCACRLIIQFSPSSWYDRIVPPEIDGGCFIRYVGAAASPLDSASVDSSPDSLAGRPRRLDGLPPAADAPLLVAPLPAAPGESSSSSSESLSVTPKCVAKMSDCRRTYLMLTVGSKKAGDEVGAVDFYQTARFNEVLAFKRKNNSTSPAGTWYVTSIPDFVFRKTKSEARGWIQNHYTPEGQDNFNSKIFPSTR